MSQQEEYTKAFETITAALASNPSINLFAEPPSPASVDNPPLYPYNDIWDSECGHSMQLDDTPGRERVRIQHGKSKNFIEMHPNGTQVVKVFGEGFDITIGKKNIYVSGACNIVVKGDCNMQVGGDFNTTVDGDYKLTVKGKMDVRSVKDINISGDSDVGISASEKFGGALRLSVAQSLNFGSDLYVNGSITCDSLTAESRVNAGMGVYAGPYGFTSSFGGLSLGLPTPATPIAVPGCITTVGPITSLVAVNAPICNYIVGNIGFAAIGISKSVLMFDIVNTLLYKLHLHPAPLGITAPPTLPMMVA
jgi:hypothetical protein